MGRRSVGVKRLQFMPSLLQLRQAMILLAIDTSTDYCSLALDCGGRVYSRHVRAGNTHSEIALRLLDELLAEAGIGFSAVQGIAYGEGPGSFTGLRIGTGIVQGLALARGLPVAGASTLEALAESAHGADGSTRVIACLDARMGEVYHAAYVRDPAGWRSESAPGLYKPEAAPGVQGEGWTGAGSGFAAYGAALGAHYGARLAAIRPDAAPAATAVLRLARPRLETGGGGDAASALPIYLRDKVALKTSERV